LKRGSKRSKIGKKDDHLFEGPGGQGNIGKQLGKKRYPTPLRHRIQR